MQVYYSPRNSAGVGAQIESRLFPFLLGPETEVTKPRTPLLARGEHTLPGVAQIVAWEIKGFLIALFAIVAGQLLTGQINMKNLLYGRKHDMGEEITDANGVKWRKKENTLYFSPERVQLLMFTLGAAFYYLTQVLDNPKPGTFPPIPDSWTATVGGSNAVYLGGKALARFWPRADGSKGNAGSEGEGK